MDLRKYIKELLYLHDCVIVPGFGGFVTNYQSSEVQRFQNVIYPPSKTIMFNKRLQNNDGVLVNHVAEKEKVGYRVAEEAIGRIASDWNRLLNNKGMLLIPDVGKLYFNAKNTLIFLPQLRKNYLPETFGLKPISYHLIKDDVQEKEEEKHLQTLVEDTAVETKRIRKIRTQRLVAAAAILIATLMIPQLFLQNFLPEKIRIEKLNLLNVPADEVAFTPERSETRVSTSEIERPAQSSPRSYTEAEMETPAVSEQPSNTISSFQSTPTEQTGNFYIAFGKFDFISDAIRQKKKLDNQFSKVFEVFRNDEGYIVGMFAGNSKTQADEQLLAIEANAELSIVNRE